MNQDALVSKNVNLRELSEKLIKENPLSFELSLLIDDHEFLIKTNEERLITKLKTYFSEFLLGEIKPPKKIVISAIQAPALQVKRDDLTVKDPEPGKKKIKEEWFQNESGRLVRKRLTDMVFMFGDDFHLAYGPCLENDNQVINFVNNRFLETRLNKGDQLGHAAAVFNPRSQRGLMMAGFSGAGKSTLSLEIMKLGTHFLSNDRVLIAPSTTENALEMRGVPKHPRINPGTIVHNEALSSLINEEERKRYLNMGSDLWDLEEKYDGFIDQCFGKNKFKLFHLTQGLILLNWKRDSSPLSIEKINLRERRDLLPAFMKQTGLFYLPNEQGQKVTREEDDYLKLLEKIDIFEASGGVNFEEAAQFCAKWMKL